MPTPRAGRPCEETGEPLAESLPEAPFLETYFGGDGPEPSAGEGETPGGLRRA